MENLLYVNSVVNPSREARQKRRIFYFSEVRNGERRDQQDNSDDDNNVIYDGCGNVPGRNFARKRGTDTVSVEFNYFHDVQKRKIKSQSNDPCGGNDEGKQFAANDWGTQWEHHGYKAIYCYQN